jgi:hypothetical protein
VRAQLICIVLEPVSGGAPVYSAGFFDPDEQRVFFVREGDTMGGRQVGAIDAHSVTLIIGTLSQRLALPDAPALGGGA